MCRLNCFGVQAFELIKSPSVAWDGCQGGLSVHKSGDGVAEGQRKWNVPCQVCLSWNIITYKAKVTASLHTEKSLLRREGAGQPPSLSSAYYGVASQVLAEGFERVKTFNVFFFCCLKHEIFLYLLYPTLDLRLNKLYCKSCMSSLIKMVEIIWLLHNKNLISGCKHAKVVIVQV